MVNYISSTTVLVTSAALVLVAQAQYFRPYPMAMDHGFSPYHPARINQETLPISQAEFAQLVAESMATSNGPHHHHPPNTDQDYEGPAHLARDNEMLHSHGGGGGGGHSAHAHHHGHHGHHHHDPHSHSHHGGHGGGGRAAVSPSSQYQPEDNYRPNQETDSVDEDNSYHRAPVYENAYQGGGGGGGGGEEESDDQLENPGPSAGEYGGRPGSNHHEAMNHQYEQQQYDHPHHMHHQQGHGHGGHGHHHGGHSQQDEGDAGESRLRPVQHYMPDNEPATIVKLVHLPM